MLLKRFITGALATLAAVFTTAAAAAPGALSQALDAAAAPAGQFAGGAPKTVTVEIVANRTAGTPRSDYKLGILLKHEPGWHTYWKFAGDTGFAPEVEWKLPRRWTAEPLG